MTPKDRIGAFFSDIGRLDDTLPVIVRRAFLKHLVPIDPGELDPEARRLWTALLVRHFGEVSPASSAIESQMTAWPDDQLDGFLHDLGHIVAVVTPVTMDP